MWSKVKAFITHPQILIATATGVSIIAQTWFFKKTLGIEVPKKYAVVPLILLTMYQYAVVKKWKWLARVWIPVTAILLSTAVIIVLHAI